MKILLVLLLLPLIANCEESRVAKIGSINNSFTAKMYSTLSKKSGNIVVSPFSIFVALGILQNGADGNSLTELRKATELSSLGNTVSLSMKEYLQLTSTKVMAESTEEFRVSNALWINQMFSLQSAFLEAARNDYQASTQKLNFGKSEDSVNIINHWVEKETNGKIKNLVNSQMVKADSRLVITNAVYFKGNWREPFEAEATKNEKFHLAGGSAIDVPTMYQENSYGYYENESLQLLEMPYAVSSFSMFVVLPKADLRLLEEKLDGATIGDWIKQANHKKVKVWMPKFEMNSVFSMNETLKKMGIHEVFDPKKANLSKITGRKELFVSAVVHKTFAKIDEKGTEAAAATAIGMVGSAMPAPQAVVPEFRADHPFLYMIVDHRSESVIFIGRVANPKSK